MKRCGSAIQRCFRFVLFFCPFLPADALRPEMHLDLDAESGDEKQRSSTGLGTTVQMLMQAADSFFMSADMVAERAEAENYHLAFGVSSLGLELQDRFRMFAVTRAFELAGRAKNEGHSMDSDPSSPPKNKEEETKSIVAKSIELMKPDANFSCQDDRNLDLWLRGMRSELGTRRARGTAQHFRARTTLKNYCNILEIVKDKARNVQVDMEDVRRLQEAASSVGATRKMEKPEPVQRGPMHQSEEDKRNWHRAEAIRNLNWISNWDASDVNLLKELHVRAVMMNKNLNKLVQFSAESAEVDWLTVEPETTKKPSGKAGRVKEKLLEGAKFVGKYTKAYLKKLGKSSTLFFSNCWSSFKRHLRNSERRCERENEEGSKKAAKTAGLPHSTSQKTISQRAHRLSSMEVGVLKKERGKVEKAMDVAIHDADLGSLPEDEAKAKLGTVRQTAQELHQFETKAAVSLGQGQGPKAEFAINEGKTGGNWVILQNCHLAVSWMPVLEKLVEELDPDVVADTFRLWLSAMPSPHFPVSVLQNGMKMTVEPPKGLKSNLLRAYLSFEEEWFDSAGNSDASRKAFRKMLFGLCFFHALIQERCNYGPLGWNIPYQFSEPDRQICVSQLKMFLEENQTIPYAALRYTASEANYGGRVTDAHDRITITNLVTDYYCEDILKDGYKFSESGTYYAPKHQPLSGYLEYIRALPINQMPEAFGLHANANLSAAIKEGLGVLSTANSMLPKGGGGDGGGKTPDQVLTELSSKFLHDIRVPFDTEWLVATYPTDYNESMNTVVNQEALRFNKLLIRVRASLVDIGKAVKGLVIMGPDLEDVANGILLNKQPAFWQKNSYPSLKPMSSYVADLVARMNFFTDWMENGHPANYWLSGFFFTQSFLTGQLQNFARKKKFPIDTLIWTFHFLKREIASHPKPEEGCIVYGLFMDGARWCNDKQVIQDSLPKVLFSEIPHMHWIPCEKDKDPTDMSKVYPSPIYKTSERKGVLSTTGHSTNFVCTIKIPIAPEHSAKFWIKRGVACLCQLDD